MTKNEINYALVFLTLCGAILLVVGLFMLFGAWAFVGCGALLLIPILFVDVDEESDNG